MRPTTPRRSAARRQRGAALLTAMIIVALVATLAGAMLWQQWRAVQVEAAERERAQSAWILAGALDWARLILREDGRASANVDHLGEPWAVPLQEARLSSFLASDKGDAEDAPDAFLSGDITDAQSRFNLRNLVTSNRIDPDALAGLQRLCETLGIPVDVASRIATGIRDALPPEPGASGASATPRPADPPLLPTAAADLSWFGIDPAVVRLLEPYVVILSDRSSVNLNTAPREVLVASFEGLDMATAERLVMARQRAPFTDCAATFGQYAPAVDKDAYSRCDVKTRFFIVRGRLRLGQVVLEQRSLVFRQGTQVTVLNRERVPGLDVVAAPR